MRSWLLFGLKIVVVGALSSFAAPIVAQEHAAADATAADGQAADEHAADGHGDDHSAAPNALPLDPDLAIWTLVVFLVLLGILSKFAWGPIQAGLGERERLIEESIEGAKRSNQEAQQMLGQYRDRLNEAADEVRRMLEEARRDAEQTKADIVAEAKSEAEAERGRAIRDIHVAADAASKDLAERGANMAVELASRIVGDRLSESDHQGLIREAVDRFDQVSPSKN